MQTLTEIERARTRAKLRKDIIYRNKVYKLSRFSFHSLMRVSCTALLR